MADSAGTAASVATATQVKLDAAERVGRAALAAAPVALPPDLREPLQSAVVTIGRKTIEYVAAGLFNAGKSSLLNSLMREPILPQSDRPETGAPAWIRRGQALKVKVLKRSGESLDLAPNPTEIAKQSSLYDETGRARSRLDLAERIEIVAPMLPLEEHMSIIDLPGLRDSAVMNDLALSIAYKADVVLWIFRSDQTFSAQDAEAVAAIVSTCGAHVVQLVLNVISDKPRASHWRAFKRDKLPIHRLRIRESAEETGLSATHAAGLLTVHARAFRHGFWGVTYGGRELKRFFKQAARKDIGAMKTARILRLVRAAARSRLWAQEELSVAERQFTEAQQRHETYQARMARRARLKQDAGAAVDRCFVGLSGALSSAASAQAAQLSTKGYKAGADFTDAVVETACGAVFSQIHSLGLSLSALAVDSEARSPSERDHDAIRLAFAGAKPGGDPDGAIRAAVRAEIGSIEARKLGLSISRAWNWVRGRGDTEAASAVSELQDRIRRKITDVGARLARQQATIRSLCQSAIEAEALPVVPPPDPKPRDLLRQFLGKLEEIDAMKDTRAA